MKISREEYSERLNNCHKWHIYKENLTMSEQRTIIKGLGFCGNEPLAGSNAAAVDLKNIDEVFSLDMVFDYDSEFFEFVDYRIPDLTDRFSTIVNDLRGKILIAMVGSRPIKSDGKVIEFVFRKNNEGNGEYYFTGFMINEREMNSKIEYVSTPSSYILYQNYPNPFNLETEVKFIIPEPCDVLLKIYNLLGEEVRTLINERREKGYYTVKWDGKDSRGLTAASGVYFYRLKAGSFVSTKKMILIK